MNKIRNIGLSLTILVALGAGNIVYAATSPANPTIQMREGNPIDSHNPQNKGLKTPHSTRKEAAKRLKQGHQQQQQQQQQQQHGGGKNQGQAGVSTGNNQAPSNQGGVK